MSPESCSPVFVSVVPQPHLHQRVRQALVVLRHADGWDDPGSAHSALRGCMAPRVQGVGHAQSRGPPGQAWVLLEIHIELTRAQMFPGQPEAGPFSLPKACPAPLLGPRSWVSGVSLTADQRGSARDAAV